VEGAMKRDDYLSLTETRFKLADPENDGKLDAKVLDTEAGQALLKLMQSQSVTTSARPELLAGAHMVSTE
jgi:hypothetical protein